LCIAYSDSICLYTWRYLWRYPCLIMTRTRDATPKRPYNVHMTRTAQDSLQKFPERVANAVVSFIWHELRREPTEYGDYGRKLYGSLTGKFAAKQRRFRVIYSINEGSHTLEILEVLPI
jgi:mRNA-degrading endonuclease RelE of RelBE toxin-antitoxin system